MVAWGFLALGAVVAVVGDIFGKWSQGHAVWHLAIPAYLCYNAAIFCWIMALKTLPIIPAYTIWTGISVVAIIIAGIAVFGEHIGPLKALLILMIIGGCIALIALEEGPNAG